MSSNLRLKDCQSAYLNFYGKHAIAPVHQDIRNLNDHFRRRKFLYHYLGIPEGLISEKSIIEFGPGIGHNALYISSLKPKKYTLVDGNITSIEECKKNIKQYYPDSDYHQFIYSRIEDFSSAERYDIVLCEGVITHQPQPEMFAQHVAGFAKPGGVTVITTADYVSVFAEVLRRVMCVFFVEGDASIEEKTSRLTQVFSEHLKTLPGMSRLHEDFILDNMIHPWTTRLFSIKDAITGLSNEHDVLGSSPRFITDWRWYKSVSIDEVSINEKAIDLYLRSVVNFIDYRVEDLAIDQKAAYDVCQYCEEIYWAAVDVTEKWSMENYQKIAAACLPVRDLIKKVSPLTAESINEAIEFFKNPSENFNLRSTAFKSWFGRGQQYLSFVKR